MSLLFFLSNVKFTLSLGSFNFKIFVIKNIAHFVERWVSIKLSSTCNGGEVNGFSVACVFGPRDLFQSPPVLRRS